MLKIKLGEQLKEINSIDEFTKEIDNGAISPKSMIQSEIIFGDSNWRLLKKTRFYKQILYGEYNNPHDSRPFIERLFCPQKWVSPKGSYEWGNLLGGAAILYSSIDILSGLNNISNVITCSLGIVSGIIVLIRKKKFFYYYILVTMWVNVFARILSLHTSAGTNNVIAIFILGILWLIVGTLNFRYFYRRKLMFGFTREGLISKIEEQYAYRCAQCNTELAPYAKFCPKCGVKVIKINKEDH